MCVCVLEISSDMFGCLWHSHNAYVCVCVFDPPTMCVVAQAKLVCLHVCMCIGVYVSVNLLLMLGRYSGIGVALQGRIASLLTEQSTSCPLYKQTGYNDQYGYQTHPTVGGVCLNMRVRKDKEVRKRVPHFKLDVRVVCINFRSNRSL